MPHFNLQNYYFVQISHGHSNHYCKISCIGHEHSDPMSNKLKLNKVFSTYKLTRLNEMPWIPILKF